MIHLSEDRFIKHLYRADFDPLSFTIQPYLDYVKYNLSQKFLNKLLLETLVVNNICYTTNVLAILSFSKLDGYEIDATIFKTLSKKTDACTVDAVLRFIEHHPEMFYLDFVKSLDIKIGWLAEYRDSIGEEYEHSFKRSS